jgi:hypothetical protein
MITLPLPKAVIKAGARLDVMQTGATQTNTTYWCHQALAYPSQWVVANKTIANLQRAIFTRVFCVKQRGVYVACPKPLFRSTSGLNHFRDVVLKHFVGTPVQTLGDMPTLWNGSKRKVYSRAAETFELSPLSELDGRIKAHTKVEKVNVSLGPVAGSSSHEELLSKDPRVIQARSPRYNVQLGRFLKLNEHNYFKAIDKTFHRFSAVKSKTVMKGLNASSQGEQIARKWHAYRDPVAIRIDAKRFDQHVSELLLSYEHTFYTKGAHKMCATKPERKLLRELLKMQLRNRCTGRTRDGFLRYVVTGNRMSGDMNTGLGNVLIMCAIMYSFFDAMLIKMESTGRGRIFLDLINNGDDCSILCESEHEQFLTSQLDAYFLDYGFELDVEGVARQLEQLKFCQSHPIWTPDGWRMVRHVQTATAKDAINLGVVQTANDYNTWRSAIAGCGLALTSGIPIMQAYYLGLGSGVGFKRRDVYSTGMEFLAHGMETRCSEVHDRTRVSFALAFGVSPALQVELEKHYASVDHSFNLQSIPVTNGVTGNFSLPY